MFKKSISSVLVAIVSVAVIISVTAIIVYVTKSSNNMALHLEQQSMQQISVATNAGLDAYMANTKNNLDMIATQRAILEAFEGDATRAKERLAHYAKANKDLWAVFLFDAKGQILAGYNSKMEDLTGQSRADRDYFKALQGGQDLFVAKEVLNAKSGDGDIFIFTMARGIKDAQGKFLGGVGIFPKWDVFTATFIDPPRFGERGYGFMIDAKGTIIAHALDKTLMLKDLSQADFIQKAMALKNGAMFYDWKGEQKYMTVSTDPDTGWTICMSAYVSEMTAYRHGAA